MSRKGEVVKTGITFGSALAMVMVCSALRPPASSSTEATTPSVMAQKAPTCSKFVTG